MKDLYRKETNHDVYADYCCERPAGSYADEYVRWLEEKLSKLSQHDVIACVCDEEDKHGWTEVKCCNECGRPIEDFWCKY